MHKNQYLRLAIFSLFFVFIQSCYQDKKGCLDPYAANYDVSVDEACEETNCCTYPGFILKLEHKFDSLNFNVADTFVNNLGQKFIMLEQKFYLSNIQIYNKTGDSLPFLGSYTIPLKTGVLNEIKRYAIVTNAVSQVSINNINTQDSIARLRLKLGLSAYYNEIDTLLSKVGSDFGLQSKMYNILDGKFYSYTCKIICGDSLKDTVSIKTYMTQDFNINLSKNIRQNQSQDLVLNLLLDYSQLMKDVIFIKPNEIELTKMIEKNLEYFIR